MYNTYRNLYRIRPSITSIGVGSGRIKLPRNMEITIDTVVLFILMLLLMSLIIPIVNVFVHLDYPIIWILGISALSAYKASKVDPSGKPVIVYVIGLLRFFLRSKTHNGWNALSKNRIGKSYRLKNVVKINYLDRGCVGSLPAVGRLTEFELRVSTAIKVKRGVVRVGRSSRFRKQQIFKPGNYVVEDNLIKETKRVGKPNLLSFTRK